MNEFIYFKMTKAIVNSIFKENSAEYLEWADGSPISKKQMLNEFQPRRTEGRDYEVVECRPELVAIDIDYCGDNNTDFSITDLVIGKNVKLEEEEPFL